MPIFHNENYPMRHSALNSALSDALPNDSRNTFKILLASMEDIQQAVQDETRQAALMDQTLALSNTIMKERGDNPELQGTMANLLTQVGAANGAQVVSTEGLVSVFTQLSGFWKTRKPGELPGADGDRSKRQQAVAKFIQELDKTYLNSQWLAKQKFVTTPVNASDVSANFDMDGKPSDDVLKSLSTGKSRVVDFMGKWSAVLAELDSKVQAIHKRTVAATRGAAEDDKEAIKKVRAAIAEFNDLPDPMSKLPKMAGTSLGNIVIETGKRGDLVTVAKPEPVGTATLPPFTKEQVLEAAGVVKMMLKGDWSPEMKYSSWLDYEDGSSFSEWIYEADYDAYENYYDRFYHQSAGNMWTYDLWDILDEYKLATALIKLIDRSVV